MPTPTAQLPSLQPSQVLLVETSSMDSPPSVQEDAHLIAAGECFMFLSWVHSAMCDLLALHSLGPQGRARYNAAYQAGGPWPAEFSDERLTLSKESFRTLKNRFLDTWPQWRTHAVHEAIERVVLLRNAIGHAHVQLHRPYLLYVPEDGRWPALGANFTCERCRLPLLSCTCAHATVKSLILPCREPWFVASLYADIQCVDTQCLLPTAKFLGVEYQGCAWPDGSGSYSVTRHSPNGGNPVKLWYDLYDLEHALSKTRSANSRTARQRYLRIYLRRLGLGVGRGGRYGWATESELHKVRDMVNAAVDRAAAGETALLRGEDLP